MTITFYISVSKLWAVSGLWVLCGNVIIDDNNYCIYWHDVRGVEGKGGARDDGSVMLKCVSIVVFESVRIRRVVSWVLVVEKKVNGGETMWSEWWVSVVENIVEIQEEILIRQCIFRSKIETRVKSKYQTDSVAYTLEDTNIYSHILSPSLLPSRMLLHADILNRHTTTHQQRMGWLIDLKANKAKRK